MHCSLLRLQFTSSSLHKAIADGFWTHYKIFSTYLLTAAVALLKLQTSCVDLFAVTVVLFKLALHRSAHNSVMLLFGLQNLCG